MATLEKIRSKSVFLIIVIGVALLAFIVGDALTNSRNIFGDHTTVAKVGGTKIDYTEYQRKREELNNQLEQARRTNPDQYANFDTQILAQMALNQLLAEHLVNDAAAKAGIQSSPNILRYYMLEMPGNPEVSEIIGQLNASGYNVTTPQQAYELIFNPTRNGMTEAQAEPFKNAWLAAEKSTDTMIKQQIYQRLLSGTVRANKLDKKALYNDYVSTRNVDLAFLPYGELDAQKYPVSDDEIKELYNKEKGRFMVEEPTREISFIAVNIMPSEADQKASDELARKTLAQLSKADTLNRELKKEGVSLSHYSMRASDIPFGLRELMANARPDSAILVSSNLQGFSVIRLNSHKTEADSVVLNLVTVNSKTLGNDVLAALNTGLSIDSVSSRFGTDSIMVNSNMEFELFNAQGETNTFDKASLDSLRNAGGRYIVMQEAPQGMLLAKMVRTSAPVSIYNYEEATYTLTPSQQTKNEERARFEKFLGANNTAEKFNENAEKSGYSVMKYTITASTPAVPRFQGMNQYFPDSRQVIRWAMIDGETGQVSHIYSTNDALHPAMYAAAIDDSYDEYVPATNKEVKEYLTQRVRAGKAGDELVKKYSANTQSVQSAAQAMGVSPRSIPAYRFGNSNGIGDAEIMGQIAGAKAAKKVVLVKGIDGVYAYQVNSVNTEDFPYNDMMYQQQYQQLVPVQFVRMLQGKNKLKNNIYKFEAGE